MSRLTASQAVARYTCYCTPPTGQEYAIGFEDPLPIRPCSTAPLVFVRIAQWGSLTHERETEHRNMESMKIPNLPTSFSLFWCILNWFNKLLFKPLNLSLPILGQHRVIHIITYIKEEHLKFQSEVSEKKDVIFSPSQFTDPCLKVPV